MKQLLILTTCFCCYNGFAQDDTNIQKLLKEYKLNNKTFSQSDSLSRYVLPPGSIKRKFMLLGNNGNGQNVYILPLDKMPMLRPDSTFYSNMPVVH